MLTEKISTGGMGTVWEARSNRGRLVVIKEPLLNNDHDRVKIERLLIETEVLRMLNDEAASAEIDESIREHVVRYVDGMNDPPHPFLVTEYLSGQTTNQAYRNRPLNENNTLRHALTLLNTVQALHAKDVLHCDISPSNIFLDCERGMVLIDFGTCMVVRDGRSFKSRVDRIIFKEGFSAPELLRMRADARSDVYSVGATMFYFLTGRNPADFIRSQADGLERLPKEVGSKISSEAFELMQRAMAFDPADRFQSAREMIAATETQLVKKPGMVPTIKIAGLTYALKTGFVDVGRAHDCGADCRAMGYTKAIQVRVVDPQNFIEKHHARIWVDPSGQCFIEDLRSTNRTAIKHANLNYEVLQPSVKEELLDGDVVALVYTEDRGPYLTFPFNAAG